LIPIPLRTYRIRSPGLTSGNAAKHSPASGKSGLIDVANHPTSKETPFLILPSKAKKRGAPQAGGVGEQSQNVGEASTSSAEIHEDETFSDGFVSIYGHWPTIYWEYRVKRWRPGSDRAQTRYISPDLNDVINYGCGRHQGRPQDRREQARDRPRASVCLPYVSVLLQEIVEDLLIV
jgi:hypothetical protein